MAKTVVKVKLPSRKMLDKLSQPKLAMDLVMYAVHSL